MTFGTLSIDLVAKLAKFEADMGKAARASERTAQQIEKSLGNIKAGFVALAGAISVNALVNYFQAVVDGADDLGKLAQRTGIAVETLGGLGYAASLAGGDVNTLADAADKLNLQLAKAAGGDKTAIQAFEALGISVKDLEGKTKSVDVALGEIADRFATFADGPEKSALAIRLMSEAGARQIPLLNQGGDAIRAQAEEWKRYSGVTAQLTQDAEKFNDTMSKIGLLASALGTEIAAKLLPSLQAVADEFLRVKENGSGFSGIGDAIANAFDFIALSAARVVTYLKSVGYVYAGLFATLSNPLSIRSISEGVREDINRALADLARFEQRLGGAIGNGQRNANDPRRLDAGQTTRRAAPRLPGSGDKSSTSAKKDKELDLTNKALARYIEQLETSIQKTQDLTAVEEALLFLRKEGTGASTEDAARILNLARQIDATRQLTAETEALADVDRALAEQQRADQQATEDRLKSLIDATPTAKLEESRKDMLLLVDALERGFISQSVYLEAVSESLGLTADKLEKTKTLAEDLGLTFTSAFEDAIVGGKGFSEVLKGLEQDILRIVTRKLVTDPLGNAITGALGGSGGGGFFSSILGSIFGGARADGGPVTGGVPYLVGERGPEMFVPRGSGAIVPNHAMGGGGRPMNIHINPPSGMSRQASSQFAADVARQLRMADARNG